MTNRAANGVLTAIAHYPSKHLALVIVLISPIPLGKVVVFHNSPCIDTA
uniref:Uncharacterized protein n=1 Tax=Anguilla anguilla TaxID=7936 RepID=A0A0E9PID1_ANGAN